MRFEKVSLEAWMNQCEKLGIDTDNARECYDNIQIPKRSTSGSCGYDFICPIECIVTPERVTMIPTGIRVFLNDNKFLMLVPRSSCIKNGYTMANNVGIIDADYINADNEGNIMVPVISTGKVNWAVKFKVGDKIAQGIIVPFFKAEEDEVTTERTGGFGSTGESVNVEPEFKEEPDNQEITPFTDEEMNDIMKEAEESDISSEKDIDLLFEEFERKVEPTTEEKSKEEVVVEEKHEESEPEVEKEESKQEEITKEEKERPNVFENDPRIRFNNNIVIDGNIINQVIVEEINRMIELIKVKDPSTYIDILDLKNKATSIKDIENIYNVCNTFCVNLNDKRILSESYLRDAFITTLNSNYNKVVNVDIFVSIYKTINILRNSKCENKVLLDAGKAIYEAMDNIDSDKIEKLFKTLSNLIKELK